MTRLARNVSANLLSNAWSTVLALGLTPVYVRLLGVESYGLIGFYMSWVAILGILDTGISATAMRQVAWLAARADERAKTASLLRSLEITYWAIIAGAGGLLLAGVWQFGGGWFQGTVMSTDALHQALVLMVFAIVVQVPAGLYIGGLMGLQQQVQCSTAIALFGTIRGLGAVAVLVAAGPDIRAFFLWQIGVGAAQTGVMKWLLARHVRAFGGSGRFSLAQLRALRGFAGGMSAVTALSLVLTQADKIILSRFVALEVFGLYMLAWTVASGLARLATPLLQAFGPQFTQMVSSADSRLGQHVRIARQMTNALILPAAALLVLLASPILLAWTGDADVASGAAPLLAVLTVGAALSSCGYPAITAFYSTGQIRPVVVFHIAAILVTVPVLIVGVIGFGAMGAALAWSAYGLFTYVSYERLGLASVREKVGSAILRDFVAPAVSSIAVAVLAWHWVTPLQGRLQIAAAVTIALMCGWAAALLVCRDLLRSVFETLRWKPLAIRP